MKMAAEGAGRQQGEAAEPRERGENEDGKEGEKDGEKETAAGLRRPAGRRKAVMGGRKERRKRPEEKDERDTEDGW